MVTYWRGKQGQFIETNEMIAGAGAVAYTSIIGPALPLQRSESRHSSSSNAALIQLSKQEQNAPNKKCLLDALRSAQLSSARPPTTTTTIKTLLSLSHNTPCPASWRTSSNLHLRLRSMIIFYLCLPQPSMLDQPIMRHFVHKLLLATVSSLPSQHLREAQARTRTHPAQSISLLPSTML